MSKDRAATVLIVDDDPTIRLLAAAALEESGYRVFALDSGEEALETLGDIAPDLLLLDVVMPGIDGFETCRRIRQLPNGRLLPIVVMTALGDVDSVHKAFEAGATDFLSKPINWAMMGYRVSYTLRAANAFNSVAQSEEKYRTLLRAIPDDVIRISADGTILEPVSGGGAESLFPPDAPADTRLSDLLPPSAVAEVLAAAGSALRAQRPGVVECAVDRAGERRHFELRLVASGASEALLISRDITERIRAGEMLRDRDEQLRQSQKLEAIGRLAGGVAHDFNNLLTVIMGYTNVLLRKVPPESPLRKEMTEIELAGERAASLVRQLLAYSRKQMLKLRVLDANEVVTGVETMLKRLIGEHIRLEADLAPAPVFVKVDKGQLEQVLINLAVNARDAMPRGGNLTIRTIADAPPAPEDGGKRHHAIEVADTGEGMNAETARMIFEPFFTTKEVGKGTGLGLSTVYGIVEQCGGRISVTSEPGNGTRFLVRFPAIAPPASSPPSPPHAPAPPAPGRTILVSEDETAVRDLVALVLTAGGYHVLPAADGGEAVAVASSFEGPIDLLLTDVVMPRMGGIEADRRIRERRPGIRTLFMSGYNEDFLLPEEAGSPAALISKPFDPDELLARVREALEADTP
jgi:signal transduction histidine kinase